MTNRYHVFEYRSPEQVASIFNAIARASASSKNTAPEESISEAPVSLPKIHTKPGKGQRKSKADG